MILRFLTKQFYINLLIVIIIFTIDRTSKAYVIYLDKFNQGYELFSSKFLNWRRGGHFYEQGSIHFTLNENAKNNASSFTFVYTKILTLWVTF